MIQVTNVRKSFGSSEILCGVTLVIQPGQLVGIIGRSGAGKSLLARCITGLDSIDSGSIECDGLALNPRTTRFAPESVQVRKRVGMVFPPAVVAPYRTALDLILEGLVYVQGLSCADAHSAAAPWIERLGLSAHILKYPRQLSTGQLARVSLARAVVMKPDYILCDEITANLDPILAGEVADIIRQLVLDGIGVVLITHQIAFVRREAKYVYYLSNGCIAEQGEAAKVLASPETGDLEAFITGVERGR